MKWLFQKELLPWLKGSSRGFKIGLLLASIHLILFLASIFSIIFYNEGRWNLFWTLCGYIDFPVSIILTHIILPLYSRGTPIGYAYLSNRIETLMVFTMFHAFVGTMWYFWLPILIEKACKKVKIAGWKAWVIVLMIIAPILAHWLQLIRFVAQNNYPFVPTLYSILPAIWTVFFILLLIVTRKKALLWLLFLMPCVYYYFIRDLYYYITLTRHYG